MMDPQTQKYIRDEIKRALNIILSGAAGSNDQFSEDIDEMFPGMPTITKRPVMHPYGLSSRAPAKTLQVVARQGEHYGNRLILGHRDANRPSLGSGETILYNQYGQTIYLENGKIHIGKKTSSNPTVLGNELKELLTLILNHIMDHTHLGDLGYPTGKPINKSDFASDLADFVANKKILSDYIFVEKSP